MANRQFERNDDAFSDISNLEACYWAGFIAADGFIYIRDKSQNAVCVSLADKDKEHLDKLKTFLGYSGEVKYYSYPEKNHSFYRLVVSSNKLCSDLELNFGIKTKKSKTIELPNLYGKQLLAYIVGYIDGDGCFTYSNNTYLSLEIISGSYIFITELQQTLDLFFNRDKSTLNKNNKSNTWAYRISVHSRNREKALELNSLPIPKLERKWGLLNNVSSKCNSLKC